VASVTGRATAEDTSKQDPSIGDQVSANSKKANRRQIESKIALLAAITKSMTGKRTLGTISRETFWETWTYDDVLFGLVCWSSVLKAA